MNSIFIEFFPTEQIILLWETHLHSSITIFQMVVEENMLE